MKKHFSKNLKSFIVKEKVSLKKTHTTYLNQTPHPEWGSSYLSSTIFGIPYSTKIPINLKKLLSSSSFF